MSSQTADSQSRVSFIHNPTNDPLESTVQPTASWLISHLLSTNRLSKASATQLLRGLGMTASVGADEAQAPLSQQDELLELTGNVPTSDFNKDDYVNYVRRCRLVAREMGISSKDPVILVNGRVRRLIHSSFVPSSPARQLVGPVGNGDFLSADFKALEVYELRKRAEPVMKALEAVIPSATERDRFVIRIYNDFQPLMVSLARHMQS